MLNKETFIWSWKIIEVHHQSANEENVWVSGSSL